VIFPEILGHERARNVLSRILASGRLPHAFLFHGPEGVGKGVVARLFANSLVCTQPGTDATGCGSCPACRKAAHGNHPDVLVVTRLPKKDRRTDAELDDDEDDGEEVPAAKGGELRPFIVVQQIRELNHHATYAPREGRRGARKPDGHRARGIATARASSDGPLALLSGRIRRDGTRGAGVGASGAGHGTA
jgi:DNA polymerase III gamma/tau subunit